MVGYAEIIYSLIAYDDKQKLKVVNVCERYYPINIRPVTKYIYRKIGKGFPH